MPFQRWITWHERVVICCCKAVADTAFALGAAASRLPVWGPLQGRVLDTILGLAEDFDYVSTTAPTSPPPTI